MNGLGSRPDVDSQELRKANQQSSWLDNVHSASPVWHASDATLCQISFSHCGHVPTLEQWLSEPGQKDMKIEMGISGLLVISRLWYPFFIGISRRLSNGL